MAENCSMAVLQGKKQSIPNSFQIHSKFTLGSVCFHGASFEHIKRQGIPEIAPPRPLHLNSGGNAWLTHMSPRKHHSQQAVNRHAGLTRVDDVTLKYGMLVQSISKLSKALINLPYVDLFYIFMFINPFMVKPGGMFDYRFTRTTLTCEKR